MNPVLVKELRQSVRNRLVFGAHMLNLLLLLLVSGVMIARAYGDGDTHSLGRELMGAVFFLCGLVVMLFIPLQTFTRIVQERWRENPDLQFIAPLHPRDFIFGKIFSGFALAGLFAGAGVPFLFIAYFLGGVDIPNLFFVIFASAAALLGLLLSAILLGIAPMPKLARSILSILFAVQLISVFAGGFAGILNMEPGLALTLFTRDAIVDTLTAAFAAATVAAVLYAGCVAGFRPPGSNRMGPLRVTVTVALLLFWPAWLALAGRLEPNTVAFMFTRTIRFLGHATTVVASLLLALATGESPDHSARRLRAAPRVAGRINAWLFGSGQVSGVAWGLLLLLAGLLMRGQTFGDAPVVSLVFPLTLSAFALTCLCGWRLMRRRPNNACLWLVVYAGFTLLCIVVSTLASAGILPEFCPGNLFSDNAEQVPILYLWNAAVLVPFMLLAARDFMRYKNPGAR